MNELSMTPASWCYMIAVWTIIISLNIYCFTRIFGKKAPKSDDD